MAESEKKGEREGVMEGEEWVGGRYATGWHVKDTKTMESYLKTSRCASVGASCPDDTHAKPER